MYPEQQRYWVALLNLQRTWTSDDIALSFIPPRHRDFGDPPGWPLRKARIYLLNNLELIRESYRRLEAGEPLDAASLNLGLADLTLRLQPFATLAALKAAARAKDELGGRVETLQITSPMDGLNAGTRYVRATVQRSLYYFAQYVDYRLADPAYPGSSPGRWHVRPEADGSGDLVLEPPRPKKTATEADVGARARL